jgi:hypothetical protein
VSDRPLEARVADARRYGERAGFSDEIIERALNGYGWDGPSVIRAIAAGAVVPVEDGEGS